MPDPVPMLSNPPHAWRWLGVLLLAPALLWGCWRAPFLSHDDAVYVRDDPRLQPEAAWREVFAHRPGYPFYYPLTMLTWRLDRAVWTPLLAGVAGEHAWAAGVRTGNLVLHVLAALAVWAILRRLGAGPPLAAFATAAFALHPAACESVCWPVERKNVLAAALALWAVWFHVRAAHWKHHLCAALLFAAALLSKPSALGAFAMVAVWEALRRPRLDGAQSPASQVTLRAAALRLAPWFVLSIAGTWLGFRMHAENVLPPPGGSLWTALLTDVEILWRYAANFLLPVGLSAYYFVAPIVSLSDPRLWGYGALLAALVAGSIALARPGERRLAVFGWLWFAGALGPNLNLVGLNDLMHDRFVYLSAPGFWLALGLAARGLAARFAALPETTARRLAACGLAALALFWSIGSAGRSERFAAAGPLFEDAARKQPQSAYARILLGGAYRDLAAHHRKAGRFVEAAQMDRAALAEFQAGVNAPDFDRYLHPPRAWADLALLQHGQGRFEEAEAAALRVLQAPESTWPAEHADAHALLGRMATQAGRLAVALEHHHQAVTLAPARGELRLYRAEAYLNLAALSESQGDTEGLAEALKRARADLHAISSGDAAYERAQLVLQRLDGLPLDTE